MHTQSTTAAAADLRAYFDTGAYAHASNLVLEPLPSGEHAWLKPEDDEPRDVITDLGRRALRMAELLSCDGDDAYDTPSALCE